ncbi:hypothetical protein LIA77_07447 [Sarocladium implicatum]|nr:hypothetical protein LIA77_07447 [Sarocladium implicatum]
MVATISRERLSRSRIRVIDSSREDGSGSCQTAQEEHLTSQRARGSYVLDRVSMQCSLKEGWTNVGRAVWAATRWGGSASRAVQRGEAESTRAREYGRIPRSLSSGRGRKTKCGDGDRMRRWEGRRRCRCGCRGSNAGPRSICRLAQCMARTRLARAVVLLARWLLVLAGLRDPLGLVSSAVKKRVYTSVRGAAARRRRARTKYWNW